MKTWKPVSETYEAPNGLSIVPVGSEDGLAELGGFLHNGLMVPEARSQWADLCIAGKRQVFGIRDDRGQVVANGELKVVKGSMRIMFVRGMGNAEYTAGTPCYDAAASYAAAVNARTIPLTSQPLENGFVEVVQERAPEGPWGRAMRFARERMISPFAALVLGLRDEPEEAPAAPATAGAGQQRALFRLGPDLAAYNALFEDTQWAPLTGAFRASNGVTVEPVSSRSGLRTLGYELENNLFMPQMTWALAQSCSTGRSQLAAIYKDDEGIVAYAEFRPIRGQLVAAACRGFADEAPDLDVARAVQDYVRAVNTNVFTANVALGADRFVEGEAALVANPFADDAYPDASSSLPKASRNGGGYEDGYREDMGGDWDDRPDWVADAARDLAFDPDEPLRWQALTDAFIAPNGLKIEPVTREEDLASMGREFQNALSVGARMWAESCARGQIQIVRIMEPSDGQDWKLVSNAELSVSCGEIHVNFNRAYQNVDASQSSNAALADYCTAVNEEAIAVHCELDDDGFLLDPPEEQPGPGFGM